MFRLSVSVCLRIAEDDTLSRDTEALDDGGVWRDNECFGFGWRNVELAVAVEAGTADGFVALPAFVEVHEQPYDPCDADDAPSDRAGDEWCKGTVSV